MAAGEYRMVAEGARVPFSVIAPISDYDDTLTRLYKVFSTETMDQNLVGQLFYQSTVVASHHWEAYPRSDFATFITMSMEFNHEQ